MGSLVIADFGDRKGARSPQTDKMRVLPLLLVVGAVAAMPQQLTEDSEEVDSEEVEVERKAHPSLITNCITENHKEGLDKVRECMACYENSGDPLSAEGLPKAQACTEEFLPRVNQDCADSLAALEPDNGGLGEVQEIYGEKETQDTKERSNERPDDVPDFQETLPTCIQHSRGGDRVSGVF